MIKLIIFDLWKTLAMMTGISVTSSLIDTFSLNIEKEKVRKIYETSYQTKKCISKERAAKRICFDLGLKQTNSNKLKIIEILRKSIGDINLYPHTISMLKQLRQNYKIGLISNTSVHPIRMLRNRTGLFKYTDYTIFSFQTGFLKPDLRAFKAMLKKAKCRANETVMIGDNTIDDIMPAQSLGINVILFQNYKQLRNDLEEFNIFLN